jgi:hypothetical protein
VDALRNLDKGILNNVFGDLAVARYEVGGVDRFDLKGPDKHLQR